MVAPPSKCSKELAHAVYDDFRRKAIDEAKKRAAAQMVDYDTFKNLVSVAHLRPLQAPNTMQTGACAPSWSFTPDGQRAPQGQAFAQQASKALLSATLPSQAPTTSGEFAREWRRSCPSADYKYQYLHLCGPQGLRTVFRVDISSELLKEVIQVLLTCWLGHAGMAEEVAEGGALGEAVWVAQVLEALSSAGRFALAVQMLGVTGRQILSKLVSQLAEALQASQTQTDLHDMASSDAGDTPGTVGCDESANQPVELQKEEQSSLADTCMQHQVSDTGFCGDDGQATAACNLPGRCLEGGNTSLQEQPCVGSMAADCRQQLTTLTVLLQSIQTAYGISL